MSKPFHLALPAGDLDVTKKFYTEILECKTGNKEDQKDYMFYTGYFGNEKRVGLSTFRETRPEFIIKHSVKGMLPKNKLAREMIKKLKIYAGEEHPHEAQNPQTIEI